MRFVKLEQIDLIRGEKFKIFTMLRQILGMIRLTFEALDKCPCDIFFDTTGLAFSYFVVK